jgi:hypothetical protein
VKEKTFVAGTEKEQGLEKKPYSSPELLVFGKVGELTKNVTATSGEGASGMGMT